MSLGFTEILLIVLVVLIIFGAKRIPELARSLGRASYEFQKAKSAVTDETRELMDVVRDTAGQEEMKRIDSASADSGASESRAGGGSSKQYHAGR